MSIRVLVADDHNIVRDGLKALFRGTELTVSGEAATGSDAIQLLRRQEFDIVVLDVRMRDDSGQPISACGLSLLARIKLVTPNMPVLMFSGYDNPTYIARAASLGACGYLLKSSRRDKLIDAILAGARGEKIWTREEMRRVAGALATPRVTANLEVALTQREHDVLSELVHGKSNKEIAQALNIGYETVKEHVQHILRKLGVADRTQAAIWAVRKGVA